MADCWVLGVDGGGTKTVAHLAACGESSEPTILGCGRAGSSNVRAVGERTALENLQAAITAAFEDAGAPRQTVSSACLALAGADRPEEQEQIQHWAEQNQLAERLRIVNDAWPILYAANSRGEGIALISGTGSFAFARDETGRTARCGGWGYLFGDEGSGYALALAGLRAAARCADGRGPRTRMLDLFLRHFQLDDPAELISTIYHSPIERAAIADVATLIFRACEEQDPPALQILEQAAGDLAEMVTTLTGQLTFSKTVPLAISGGVLLNSVILQSMLIDRLQASEEHAYLLNKVFEPVLGAVRMAEQAAGCQGDGSGSSEPGRNRPNSAE